MAGHVGFEPANPPAGYYATTWRELGEAGHWRPFACKLRQTALQLLPKSFLADDFLSAISRQQSRASTPARFVLPSGENERAAVNLLLHGALRFR